MPYIKQEDREKFYAPLELLNVNITSIGEMNYVITSICHDYLRRSNGKYADHNALIGVLEAAKLEFYRRQVVKYEEQKILENGDL